MSEGVENPIVEHLRHIRGQVGRIAEDTGDFEHRMSSLGSAMVLVKREVSAGDETDACQQPTLHGLSDRLERMERIERRPGLIACRTGVLVRRPMPPSRAR